MHVICSTQFQPSTEALVPASSLPSPASTIESITREFEHSLDIRSATKGQYVVKPQVNISLALFANKKIILLCVSHLKFAYNIL